MNPKSWRYRLANWLTGDYITRLREWNLKQSHVLYRDIAVANGMLHSVTKEYEQFRKIHGENFEGLLRDYHVLQEQLSELRHKLESRRNKARK